MAFGALATMLVRIKADNSGLVRGVRESERGLESLRTKGVAIAKGLAAVAAGAAAAGGALIAAANKAADFADVIDKTSIRTGIAAKTLQELRFVGDQLGVPFSAIEASIKAFTRQIPILRTGTSEASREFVKLGISLTDASGNLRRMDDLFPDVLRSLSKMENATERNAVALTLLGRGGQAMIPFIDAGADAIDGLTKKFEEMGLELDGAAIKSLVAYKDEMAALSSQLETRTAKTLATNIESIQAMAEAFNTLKNAIITTASAFASLSAAAGRGLSDLANWARDLGYSFGQAFSGGVEDSGSEDRIREWARRLMEDAQQTAANLRRGAFFPTPTGEPIDMGAPQGAQGVSDANRLFLAGFRGEQRITTGLRGMAAQAQLGPLANVTGFIGELDTSVSALVPKLRQVQEVSAEGMRDLTEGATRGRIALIQMGQILQDSLVVGMQQFSNTMGHAIAGLITGLNDLKRVLDSLKAAATSVLGNLFSGLLNFGIGAGLAAIPGVGPALSAAYAGSGGIDVAPFFSPGSRLEADVTLDRFQVGLERNSRNSPF